MILKMPKNTVGRDFIIGDLHGCWSQLMQRLAEVDFDNSVDRLFSVGDLIDRGPDSQKCLSLLKEPWFFAVQGNHEQLFLTWIGLLDSKVARPFDFLYNGGSWAEKVERSVLLEYAEIISKLPLVIEVAGAFNVAHSRYEDDLSVACGEEFVWDRRLRDALTIGSFRDIAGKVGETIFVTPYNKDALITYVGHTPTPGTNNLLMIRNHLQIDTRAYQGEKGSSDRLTMINHQDFVNKLNEV